MTEENVEKKEEQHTHEEVKKEEHVHKEDVHKASSDGVKHQVHHHVKKVKKDNMWKVISGILAILLLLSIFSGSSGNSSNGGGLSSADAGKKALEYINANLMQPGVTASIKSVEEANGLYNIKLDIGGQDFDSYITKDAGLLFPSGVDLSVEIQNPAAQTPPAATEVEKSDKPLAELYIFSYCPAGSSTLDAFAEAGKILKNVADVKVKFFSEMHGEYEKQQNIIQDCIQKVDSDKYWDYAIDFYEKVYQICGSKRDTKCDMDESIKLMKEKGIDYNEVLSCLESDGPTIYAQDKQDARALSLQYSPSVVINGVYLQRSDRSPEGLKSTICGAFNEAPEECSGALGAATTQSVGNC